VDALNHKPATSRPLTADVLHPYLLPNYETQQPSLYYSLAAPLVHPPAAADAAGRAVPLAVVLVALCGVVTVMANQRWPRLTSAA
jgi:hypothetical protein